MRFTRWHFPLIRGILAVFTAPDKACRHMALLKSIILKSYIFERVLKLNKPIAQFTACLRLARFFHPKILALTN